jgi:hypothetical protein
MTSTTAGVFVKLFFIIGFITCSFVLIEGIEMRGRVSGEAAPWNAAILPATVASSARTPAGSILKSIRTISKQESGFLLFRLYQDFRANNLYQPP